MTIPEILRDLEHPGPHPPRDALRAAVEQKEAVAPELLTVLERISGDPAPYLDDGDYMLPIYALYLLAQFRDPRALQPMLRLLSLPGEQPFQLTGDVITMDGARILASVCGGDTAPLLALACNEKVSEYVRYEAIKATAVLVVWGEKPKHDVVDGYRRLFESGLSKPGDPYVWAALVNAALDLNAHELLPEIRKAYEAGLVDDTIPGFLEDVEREFAERNEALFQDFVEANPPITDVTSLFDYWASFEEDEEELEDESTEFDEDASPPASADPDPAADDLFSDAKPIPYVAPPMPGRNDPCPCGSGKKYKKCCGKS